MKQKFRLLFLLIILLLFSSPAAAAVTTDLLHATDGYHPGETYPMLIRIRIPDGMSIHGPGVGEGLIPTALTFPPGASLRVTDIRFPEPGMKVLPYADGPVPLFSGEILVSAKVTVEKTAAPGEAILTGSLSYQACTDSLCFPPEKAAVTATFNIVSPGAPIRNLNPQLFTGGETVQKIKDGQAAFGAHKNIFLTLFLIFLGGLALNLSPCIYPMIPISVSYFGGGKMKGATLLHGIFYLLGLALTNSALGVFSALSGNMMGAALQNPAALLAVALIMGVLGLSFFDLWELRLPSGLMGLAAKNYGGYFGTFFMGLTLGIIAAPCIGPFVLGLFAYVGQKGDPFFGFLCFFVLSIGMGLPLCILALFSGNVKKLPLSGDWMLWIRKLMGWVLIAMGGYTAGPLLGQPGKSILLLLVSLAAGLHLGILTSAGQGNAAFTRIRRVAGVGILLLGIGSLLPYLSHTEGIFWQAYDEGLLSQAREAKRPVIIDFAADWCLPCKTMERTVFQDPAVTALAKSFTPLRLDVTRTGPHQTEILKKYRVAGVPAVLFLAPSGEEIPALRVDGKITPPEFLSRMNQALKAE